MTTIAMLAAGVALRPKTIDVVFVVTCDVPTASTHGAVSLSSDPSPAIASDDSPDLSAALLLTAGLAGAYGAYGAQAWQNVGPVGGTPVVVPETEVAWVLPVGIVALMRRRR